MDNVRPVANIHKRPIQFDLVILADSQKEFIHRLRTMLVCAERGEFEGNRNGSVGGNGDDTEWAIRTTSVRRK